MVHIPFTDNETDEGKPQRRALWKKVKDNDDAIEQSLRAQEGILADIFTDHFDNTDSAIGVHASFVAVHSSKWTTAVTGNASINIPIGGHVARLQVLTSTGLTARLRGNIEVFAGGTSAIDPVVNLPRLKVRTKFNHNTNDIGDFYWGLQKDRILATLLGDDFVVLHRSLNQKGMGFAVRHNGGTVTEGNVVIPTPVLETWFEFEIRYTDEETVECFFDGALIETFHGPGDPVPGAGSFDHMMPDFSMQIPSSPSQVQDMFIDRVEFRHLVFGDRQ